MKEPKLVKPVWFLSEQIWEWTRERMKEVWWEDIGLLIFHSFPKINICYYFYMMHFLKKKLLKNYFCFSHHHIYVYGNWAHLPHPLAIMQKDIEYENSGHFTRFQGKLTLSNSLLQNKRFLNLTSISIKPSWLVIFNTELYLKQYIKRLYIRLNENKILWLWLALNGNIPVLKYIFWRKWWNHFITIILGSGKSYPNKGLP